MKSLPGLVTHVHPKGNGVQVMAMEKCAGGWHWPKNKDEIDYLDDDIIQKIEFPVPISNRGTSLRELVWLSCRQARRELILGGYEGSGRKWGSGGLPPGKIFRDHAL